MGRGLLKTDEGDGGGEGARGSPAAEEEEADTAGDSDSDSEQGRGVSITSGPHWMVEMTGGEIAGDRDTLSATERRCP